MFRAVILDFGYHFKFLKNKFYRMRIFVLKQMLFEEFCINKKQIYFNNQKSSELYDYDRKI
jgi:hypothetical protein